MIRARQEQAIRIDQQGINLNAFTDLRQRSRMQSFTHIVDTVFLYQKKLDAGEKWEYQIIDERGLPTGSTLPINQAVLDTWMNMSLDLLRGFRANPAMYTMAKEYLNEKGRQQKQERAAKLTKQQGEICNINMLLENGSDKPI